MPFDAIVLKNVACELKKLITSGRVDKVMQPEKDEIVIAIRAMGKNLRLLMSANPSYPRIHLTEESFKNPMQPPMFCMLLRKYLIGGRITDISFFDYERILSVNIESLNELGDMTEKKLIIEIMGRHSNIILVNENNKIIDSIKHIDSDTSSVREVMPAREYVLPPGQEKTSPEELNTEYFADSIQSAGNKSISKLLLENIKGFSPFLCDQICIKGGVEPKKPSGSITPDEIKSIKAILESIIKDITTDKYNPYIIYSEGKQVNPIDFHCLEPEGFAYIRPIYSISLALDEFYREKGLHNRLEQKKSSIVKHIKTLTERCIKKLSLQEEALRNSSDREEYRLYGELITANIHNISPGTKSARLNNYYSEKGDYLEIPIDEKLTPQENARRYYKKYSKSKSTWQNTSEIIVHTREELDYLESVLQMLDNSTKTEEIDEIKDELAEQGILSRSKASGTKKTALLSKPAHYISSDGFDILVGKNNLQNDLLTMKTASPKDLWLHTRNIPGSHVVIKSSGREIPENSLFEAASLAAYFSRARMSAKVPVDYTEVKNVKKPKGAKPGKVIYNSFKTLIIDPDVNLIQEMKQLD